MAAKHRSFTGSAAETAGIDHEPCRGIIEGLEEEVRVLKRRLAVRAAADPLAASGKPVKRTGSGDLAFLNDLPEQDRKYMEKKLGVKK